MWLEDPLNAQTLSEEEGILDIMYDVQSETDAKEQEATIVLDNYEDGMHLFSGVWIHHENQCFGYPFFSLIEQDPADNDHHPGSCCRSAVACNIMCNVGADEQGQESGG